MSRVSVELVWYEISMAAHVGVNRHVCCLREGREDSHGFDGEDGLRVHIEGAAAECAFAKATGRYWDGSVGTFKQGGDVGRVQVRRRSRPDYDLLVRPSEADEHPDDAFVLVLGSIPSFVVVGWMYGKDMKREEWLHSYGGRPPAYFGPQSELRPLKAGT